MSTGLHARRAMGLTVAEREESLTRTEPVATWSREGWAAYEADREALLFVHFFLTGARCSNEAQHTYVRGRGFISFLILRFNFHCFCGAAVPCCASSVVQTAYRKKKNNSPT